MNEFDKEEHTEDIWYSQIMQIVACATYIYHNKENGVNIVSMVAIVSQLKNIRVELHQP